MARSLREMHGLSRVRPLVTLSSILRGREMDAGALLAISLLLSEDLSPCSGATYIRVVLSPQLTQSKNSL